MRNMISFYSGLREDLNDTLHKIIGQLVQFLLQGYITLKSDHKLFNNLIEKYNIKHENNNINLSLFEVQFY